MFNNTCIYKFLKLFVIISAAIIYLFAAGSLSEASFTLHIDNAVAHSDTQINLNWTSVTNSVYYKVSRDNTLLKRINVDTERNFLSYSDTGLLPQTTYNYSVSAINSDGKVVQTVNKSAATTHMKAPSIASYNVDLNKKSVTITWVNNSKAVHNTSVIKVDIGTIATLSNDGTSITFIDTDLDENEVSYLLSSSDGKGHTSTNSSAITVTPIELPTITADLVNKNAKISWDINNNIDEFVLERSVYLEDSWGPWKTILDEIEKDSTYFVDNLSGDGTYRYRLNMNTKNYKAYSNISNPITRLFSPSNLKCVPVSTGRIDLSWTNPPGNDYTLKVERKNESDKNYSVLSTLDSNISSYSDSNNIELDTDYYYRITAYNSKELCASSHYSIHTAEPSPALMLKADMLSSTKVKLNWEDDSDNELGFIIERATDSRNFSKIAEVTANTTTYTDNTLTIENTYTYRVIPYNPYGNANSYTNELSISTSLLKYPPASLEAWAVSTNEIKLNWIYEDSANYSTAIERKIGSDESWKLLTTLPAGFTSYNDSTLTDNSQYYYRVKTVIDENIYSKSYPDTETGVSAHTKLKSPQNFHATWSSSNTIKLIWPDKSYGAEYFIIERKIDNGPFIVVDTTSSSNRNTWYDFPLKPGRNYTYRLKSVNGKYYSDYTDEVIVEGFTISAPSNLTATIVSETEITLSWKDNSIEETSFQIEQKSDTEDYWVKVASVPANKISYKIDDLEADTIYRFRVSAYNSVYYISSESDECEILIGTLSPPTNLTAKAISSFSITLEWKDKSSSEEGFIIERRTNESEFIEIARTPRDVVKYTDSNLKAKNRYYYRVKSFNGSLYNYCDNIAIAQTSTPKTFDDLNSVEWAKTAIENLAGREIIKGKSTNPDIFAPNDKITRAEFINLVVVSLKFDKTPIGTFEDVKPEHWFYKNVIIAKNLGIISGTGNNLFYPNEPIKREDIAVILARALKISGNPLPNHDLSILDKYLDKNNISNYALLSMTILNGENIINGKSKTILAPKDYATRAEAAVILYNILSI